MQHSLYAIPMTKRVGCKVFWYSTQCLSLAWIDQEVFSGSYGGTIAMRTTKEASKMKSLADALPNMVQIYEEALRFI